MIYMGGSEQTFEYDFSTKIANTTKECPLNIYYSLAKTIKTPNDSLDSSWKDGWDNWANKSQDILDKLKARDNLSFELSSTSAKEDKAGRKAQMMVELDLNGIAQDLFGGSTDTLKNAIKSIEVDIYTNGSGLKDGQKTYGVNIAWYNQGTSPGWEWTRQDYSSSISRINKKVGREYNIQQTISKDNKVYVLINSLYPSDENTPSIVNLDYFNIKVTLSREADNIQPIPINLTDTWSIFGSYYPNYDSNDKLFRFLCTIIENDNKQHTWFYHSPKGALIFNIHDGASCIENYNIDFNKFTNIRFLACCFKNKITLDIIANSKTYHFEAKKTEDLLIGSSKIILNDSYFNRMNEQADCFIEEFQYMPNKVWTKEEAESILKGEHKYFKINNIISPEQLNEIITNTTEVLNAEKTQYINGFIIKNTLANKGYYNNLKINCLPNNKYKFDCTTIGDNIARIEVYGYVNKNAYININPILETKIKNGQHTYEIQVPKNVNLLWIILCKQWETTGNFGFYDLSLKLIP
ncbi:hypothetical protein [Clostridium botulinum]|uniref:hypothetical protein n=1 Tax=Clostridium botulinum TaxID=1491 RepID=UPI0006A3EC08|nr:hypothetical protein [Clostridium botulinum]KOC32555.1 hypothetical protein ADU81_11150 [Clostridium botulinum]